MAAEHGGPVSVSRWISAPASEIFVVLADPVRHLELDGSGMHQNAVLRRQVGRVRYEPGDQLWLAAPSRLVLRRRWGRCSR